MAYRARNILIAVALAAVAALLTSFYVTSYKRHVQRGEDHVTVLVAKQDIAPGTTGEEAAKSLVSEDIPRKMREQIAGAITKPDQLAGLVATQKTQQGQVVTTRSFGTQAELGVRAQLKGTMRAVEMWGDSTQLLAGTLKAGDHVDFVGVINIGDGVSRVFVRNLKVLQAPAAPAVGGKLTSSIGQKSWAMLAMTDNQSQKIQWILGDAQSDDNAPKPDRWHLTLRPVVHDADSTDHADTWYTVITDGLTASEKRLFGLGLRRTPPSNGNGG
jgi:Flp pilus assembly protein CpaB